MVDQSQLRKLRIVHYPDPVLDKVCEPVERFDTALVTLADRMLALMRESNGVGLAAPQVGVPIRLFVCNPTCEAGDDLVCINPQFLELNGAMEKEEGCLSLPGVTVTMRRATEVVLKAFDLEGNPFTRTGTDLLARIWQHEVDHINGRLITANMSPTDEITNRRAVKQLEEEYAASRRRGRRTRCV